MVLKNNLPERVKRRFRKLYDRTRYRLGLPEPEPGAAAVSTQFRHLVDAAQRDLLASRYRQLFPRAVETEMGEARRLAAHDFRFLGHSFSFGERIGWSYDPVSGRDWGRGLSSEIPYRGPARLGDIKLPWELNKHQYFFTLGKAAWLTGDPDFAREIIRQIDGWIADNPYRRGINWISALEVGTRAVSWILAYPFYEPLCDAPFRARLIRSLAQHMVFVEDHLSVGRFANNHLVGDSAALVVGGLFLEHRDSARWVEKGLLHLEAEMQRQVASDGVHAERSISYHRFVLDQYHLIDAILGRNGRSFSEATRGGIERMTAFLMDVIAPDGRSPFFGDGDDARGIWFRADCPADFRSPLAVSAVLFDRGDFKAVAGSLTEEVFWLLGAEGVDKFQTLAPRLPDHTSIAYPDGGYYVMRQGWAEPDAVLTFDCGPVGHGRAGHGHADALSIQLHAAGYPFLVDPGAFSYNLDYEWRHAFRSTRAHNTITIDDEDQSLPADRMAWSRMAQARTRRWLATNWLDLADGEHDGYRRLTDPVTHRRVVAYLKPDLWVICDGLAGAGSHQLELLWHLRPECDVQVEAGRPQTLLESPDRARLYLTMLDERNEPLLPQVLAGTDEERAAWFSPSYGTRLPARALSVRRQFVGQASLTTILSTSSATPDVVYNAGILSVRMERGEDREDRLHYRLDGAAGVGATGTEFDGDLLFARAGAPTTPSLYAAGFRRLKWRDTLDLRSSMPVETLDLANGRCDIAIADAAGLDVRAAPGLIVLVNGKPLGT